MVDRIGEKPLIAVGTLFFAGGLISSSFANTIYEVIFTFGIITGIGMGMCQIPALLYININYPKDAQLMTGIAVSGVSFGQVGIPFIIYKLLEDVGWRGTMLIQGAIAFHCILGVLVLTRDKRKIKEKDVEKQTCEQITKQKTEKNTLDLPEVQTFLSTGSHIFIEKTSFVDGVSILKDLHFVIFMLSYFFVSFAVSIMYIHISVFAVRQGCSTYEGALLISAHGLSCGIGRMSLGFVARRVNIVCLYAVTYMLAGIAMTLHPLMTSFWLLLIGAGFFGLFVASYACLYPGVLTELFGVKQLGATMGYSLIAALLGNLTGGPVAGALYDSSRSYTSSFLVGGTLCFLAGLVMLVPWRCRSSRALSDSDSDQVMVHSKCSEETDSNFETSCSTSGIASSICSSDMDSLPPMKRDLNIEYIVTTI